MSDIRAVLRRGPGRHRRRRRVPLTAAAAAVALVAGSAFAVTSMDDDRQECDARAGRGGTHDDHRRGGIAAMGACAPRPVGDGALPHRPPEGHGAPANRPAAGGRPARAGVPDPESGYDRDRCGNASGRVLLSLDDWPYDDPERAVRVGAQLQSQGVRAAFFLINQYASQYPRITTALRRQGHWVGSHTWSHQQLTQLSDQELQDELRNGVPGNFLRPPYGDVGQRETEAAASLGQRVCNWTIDTYDWQQSGGAFRDVDAIRASVREASAEEKTNGVILGHLFSHFPEALPGIIGDLREQGYRMCRNTGPVTEQVPYPLEC
ncbi:polysaccharide deacetylase family protein [Streptomyces sp. AV19]|uniref:polysaccharide deacetylase family protein n=1 Tax=Streptomyces sp. AV19 TaxID=2793068 RepID=UPI0018FE9139|nr:polysaccharide deacetylase family protein [Streptomyces sp. AV19]MBH1937902.1 polysaccharide deacetylase family protein [Streptomyces sp. AV19]MDG4536539.1 polysaccharide deacetylase family protein [Streptomyces sp. AV19]